MQMKRHFTKMLSRSLQMFKNSTCCTAAQLLASVSMGPGRFLQFHLFIPLAVQRYSFFFPSFICCFIFFRQSCYVAQAGLTLGILLPQSFRKLGLWDRPGTPGSSLIHFMSRLKHLSGG